jgi:hypothetical protein
MRIAMLDDVNERAVVGGNNPPGAIELAGVAMDDLGRFLQDTPVIETSEQAKAGALFVERGRKTLQDMEAERKTATGPLNEELREINERYRAARDPFDCVLSELRRRLTDHTAREEAKRIRAAELARQAARDAEMEARRAEEAEKDAKSGATFGEVTDVAAKIVEADQAFSRFTQADRAASLAERETSVRLPSQRGGKALSLRTKEILFLDDPRAAVDAICAAMPLDGLHDAILSAARAYRKQTGRLPPGVRAEHTRSI